MSLDCEKRKLKGVSSGRTMQSIRSDVQEKEVVINGISRKIEQKRDTVMDSQSKLSELEREVNKLNSQKVYSLFIFNILFIIIMFIIMNRA